MKKCIVIPDSFKGTMTSTEVCNIINQSIKNTFPECEVLSIPVADGGEGTVECFLSSVEGNKVYLTVKNAFNQDIKSFYGIIGKTAVIEMAAAAGIISNERLDPLTASTYGVGELIKHAVNNGCSKIILGLGGSCTNDAGTGMAAALGTKFYDENGRSFIPTGGTLANVSKIDNSDTEQFLDGVEIQCMCDIDNVMYGEQGAAYVFAPQKGADKIQVDYLDKNLRIFSRVIQKELNVDVSEIKGGGAAGAMGAGAYAFLNAQLKQGIDVVLDLIQFDSIVRSCDYVFTGEGKLDIQSLNGKVVVGVGKRAQLYRVPVIAVVGTIDIEIESIYNAGISAIYTTTESGKTLKELKKNCRQDLIRTMQIVLKDIDNFAS